MRPCDGRGNPYEPRSARSRYCSAACRARAHRGAQEPQRELPPPGVSVLDAALRTALSTLPTAADLGALLAS